MAERYYGLNLGENEEDMTEGSSSTAGLDVEVRIDLAGIPTGGAGRSAVLQMIDMIKNAILKDTWPPA